MDLERFASKWSLSGEEARMRARLTSTMEEIQDFYDTLLPRMDAVIVHLNRFPLDRLPEEEQRLLYLAMSFMEAAVCVELFEGPDMPWGIEAQRMKIGEHWKQC